MCASLYVARLHSRVWRAGLQADAGVGGELGWGAGDEALADGSLEVVLRRPLVHHGLCASERERRGTEMKIVR